MEQKPLTLRFKEVRKAAMPVLLDTSSADFAKAVAWGKAEILRSRPRHKVYSS